MPEINEKQFLKFLTEGFFAQKISQIGFSDYSCEDYEKHKNDVIEDLVEKVSDTKPTWELLKMYQSKAQLQSKEIDNIIGTNKGFYDRLKNSDSEYKKEHLCRLAIVVVLKI